MTVLELEARISALETKVAYGFDTMQIQHTAVMSAIKGSGDTWIGVNPKRLLRVAIAFSVACAFVVGGAAGTAVALLVLAMKAKGA